MSTTRFVSYLRVSTSKQAASGLGIEAQRAAIAEFVRFTGADQIAEYVEAESGANDERAQLRAAIEECRSRKASLLVAKLDRLARSVAFVSAVMDSDVPLVAADNPHASRLVLHMLAAVAEFEREQISHRTKAALAAAKARGVKLGTAGRVLAARHSAEAHDWSLTLQAVIDEARRTGATTPTRIAAYLNDRAIASRHGGRWHPSNAARLCGGSHLPLEGDLQQIVRPFQIVSVETGETMDQLGQARVVIARAEAADLEELSDRY